MQTTKIEAFKIIGLSIRTTNKNGQAANDIAALWGRFMAENILSKIPNKVNQDIYSLYTEYEGDHTAPYTTILGCRVENLDDIPDGLVGKEFAGGTFAKTSTKGNLMQGVVVDHWHKIYAMDLNRTFAVDFEIYGEKASDPSNAEVDFYVGINI